jgi:nicotinamide-nucleotide amidase
MNAAILTIGEEILIGQIIDTNSAWIASELNQIGIRVREIVSISDSSNQIKESVEQLLNKYDIVFSTGGLGPTSDDITKQTICEIFDSKLVTHEPTLEHISSIFEKRGLPLTKINAQQAEIPHNCEVLFNPSGTAPGMWFERNGKIFISMPGVPFEMKAIMEIHIFPRLKEILGTNIIIHKTIQTFGLPESFLSQTLSEWESALPKSISLAYLPSPTSIRLRLSSSGSNKALIDNSIKEEIKKLQDIIPENIFGYNDDTMASVIGRILKENSKTISVAESCTGGTIAKLITEVPGSSNYFVGGIVAYSNNIKINFLDVDPNLINEFGAVSKQVVEAMAIGILKKFNTDYSIATSGIAGPTGATENKPLGTVWICIASKDEIISRMYNYGGDRERNILRSSVTALNLLRLHMKRNNFY